MNIDFLKKNIQSLRVRVNKKKPVFFISTNLFNLGLSKKDSDNFSKYLLTELGKFKDSTILVPTATLNILDTKEIFNKLETKSSRMGFFSEYVRRKKKSSRSNHPLWSFTALGYYSKKIIKNVPKTCYGRNSVFDRLLDYNSYYINFGDIKSSLAPIHYAEQMAGVPYRFFKEFKIKSQIQNKVKIDTYYFYAMIESLKIIKDDNNKIIKILLKDRVIKVFKNKKFNVYFAEYNKLIKNLFQIYDKNPKIYLKNEKINFFKNLKFR
jgi:aminoglycoside 3-N-acetyltransferase